MTNKKLLITVVAAFVAFGAVLFPRVSDAQAEATESWRAKVAPDLLERVDSLAGRTGADDRTGRGRIEDAGNAAVLAEEDVDVIIKVAGRVKGSRGVSTDHAIAIQSSGGMVKKGLALISGIAARLPLRAVEELAQREDVVYVSPDRPVSMMGHLETTTGAAQTRTLVSGISSLDGTGVGIAVLDSGVDTNHHELSYLGVSRVSASVRASRFYDASDVGGHGTHVAAVAAGTNHIGPNAYTGMAYGANIINVKVLDRTGKGYTSDIIDGVNWCVTYRLVYDIRVINMSLGAPALDSYKNDPLCQAVRAAHDAGIVVVVAAGNDGKDQDGEKIYGAIHSPGTEPSAITVGAANTKGTDSRSDDVVTSYSSRGPTRGYTKNVYGQRTYDNLIKPDLVAPGNRIISAQAYNCDAVKDHPELDANQYETNSAHYVMYMSGTSVAAPVVSGAVALLLEANPSLTPNLVKAILMYSAQPLAGFNTLEQGAGLLNVDGAVRLAKAIKNPVTGLSNGQSMLATSLPSQQSTIAGQTFNWGQGVITDWTFLYGSGLMTYWQGMYAKNVLLADGTYLSGNAILKNTNYVSTSPSVANGVILADGTLLASGTLVTNGQGTLLADGTLLNEGVVLADAKVTCDGTLLGNGVIMSDAYGLFVIGDPFGMTPKKDNVFH